MLFERTYDNMELIIDGDGGCGLHTGGRAAQAGRLNPIGGRWHCFIFIK